MALLHAALAVSLLSPDLCAEDAARQFEERIAKPVTVGMGPSLRIFGGEGVFGYTARNAAPDAVRKPVLIYDCLRLKSPPSLTGRITDRVWRDLPAATHFVTGLYDGPPYPLAVKQTVFRAGYDDQALYLAIDFHDPDVSHLRANFTKYDDRIWWDDSTEVYIEPGFSHQRYFKFMVNPIGTRHDAYAENALYGFVMDSAWGSGTLWTAAAGRDDRGWYAEMRIPFSDMDAATPQPGALFSFQVIRFCRTMQGEKDGKKTTYHEYSSWAPGGNVGAQERFGYLLFSGGFSDLERLFVNAVGASPDAELELVAPQGRVTYTTYAKLQEREIRRASQLAEQAATGVQEKQAVLLPSGRKKVAEEVGKIQELAKRAAQALPRTISEEADIVASKVRRLEWELRLFELAASYSVPKGGQK